ncbi:hypothetical protein CFR80_18165 [Komagataeibacter oboediens]|uniref:HEPN domain-containing protein n=1 Tax=Komagataeibacter oboediens TaxID=65958 RepID=A0A318QWR0_9PROT|nr:HEPN domain-containing protein [Komagataeibacter oboediens]PYD77343.1 hypothetical protein CFR80_18165 [Komagataeibacter oboediens]
MADGSDSSVLYRDDWVINARRKFASAEILFDAGQYQEAFELAGIAVECALKAKLMKMHGWNAWPGRNHKPPIEIHDLQKLCRMCGAWDELQEILNSTPDHDLIHAWGVVNSWRVNVRYKSGSFPAPLARDIVSAVGDKGLLEWLLK